MPPGSSHSNAPRFADELVPALRLKERPTRRSELGVRARSSRLRDHVGQTNEFIRSAGIRVTTRPSAPLLQRPEKARWRYLFRSVASQLDVVL